MFNVLLEAVLDTLKVFPFLLALYVLICFISHSAVFSNSGKLLQGRSAPLSASAAAVIPESRFSATAAELYDKGTVRTGTALAAFIAASGESLVILLSSGVYAAAVMPLAVILVLLAAGTGYLINFILSWEKPQPCADCVTVNLPVPRRTQKSAADAYFISPLLHSLKTSAYLLIVNVIVGFIIAGVGEEKIAEAVIGGVFYQPFITAAIGLIPDGAVGTIITGAYTARGILFGSCVSGLCANAGNALALLCKNTAKTKRNVLFILTLYLVSAAAGLAVNALTLLLDLI